MSMNNPEVYLFSFSKTVKNLLRASAAIHNPELEKELSKIYRKITISEIFYNKYIIAISGLQGAGKTNMIKEIYEIPDTVIDPNLGRGEKTPVMITEGAYSEYSFSKKVIHKEGDDVNIKDIPISVEEFSQLTKRFTAEVVLLELKVPFRMFSDTEKSFVLLPGIEDSCEEFQEMLMHALVSSATCIFLFDEVRYADARNTAAINKIMSVFMQAKPIFTLTMADRSINENKDLFENFKRDFDIKDDDRIIITGKGKDFKKEWMPKLMSALDRYRNIEGEFRKQQFRNLKSLLIDDLGNTITRLENELEMIKIGENVHRREVENSLKMLREKVAALRKEYSERLKQNLNHQGGEARSRIDKIFADKGLWDGIVDFFTKDAVKRQLLQEKIKEAWSESAGKSSHSAILKTINYIQWKEGLLLNGNAPATGEEIVKKGKYNEDYLEIDDDLYNDYKILLRPEKTDSIDWKFSDKLEKNIRRMPTLILESARITTAFPNFFKVDNVNYSVKMVQTVNQVADDYGDLVGGHSKIIKASALMLGLDAAYDGKIDSIPHLFQALSGASAGSFAMTAATGVSVVLGGMFIYKSILNQIDKSDLKNIIAANSVISQLIDHHHAFYLQYFDDIMDIMLNRVQDTFIERYHLSEEFTRKEALTKAIADAKKIRNDFRAESKLIYV